MRALARLDEAAARRWPRGLRYRAAPVSAALAFMVIGVVCLIVGGRAHAVGIGASGAAIGLMITALRRPGSSAPSEPPGVADDPGVRPASPPAQDITGLASTILGDEGQPGDDR